MWPAFSLVNHCTLRLEECTATPVGLNLQARQTSKLPGKKTTQSLWKEGKIQNIEQQFWRNNHRNKQKASLSHSISNCHQGWFAVRTSGVNNFESTKNPSGHPKLVCWGWTCCGGTIQITLSHSRCQWMLVAGSKKSQLFEGMVTSIQSWEGHGTFIGLRIGAGMWRYRRCEKKGGQAENPFSARLPYSLSFCCLWIFTTRSEMHS